MQKCVQGQKEAPETLTRKADYRFPILAIAVTVLSGEIGHITSSNFERLGPAF
jgi:hypothetical protein